MSKYKEEPLEKKYSINKGQIGVLKAKTKSLGQRESVAGSEQLSLAKQNAQKIKNVVHRLSLSTKAPVLSKRQLKLMQDNLKEHIIRSSQNDLKSVKTKF